MNLRINFIFLLLIINIVFGLNPQIKNELPVSSYINPEEYISIDSLIKFENIGYEIEDPIERSKYYFVVAYLLNQKIEELNVKTDNIIGKISNLITSYEEKLSKNHYTVNHEYPIFNYEYEYIKFSDKAIINKVFYKQANVLKEQYLEIYKYQKRKIELMSDYLLALREEYVVKRTQLVKMEYEENLENRFYLTVYDMLSSNLISEAKLTFLNTITDNNGNIISIINIENIDGEDIISSKDFEYFNDGLLSGIRERKNGFLTKEILYGGNKYSKEFYDFVFESSFQPLNYDNFTEIYYK